MNAKIRICMPQVSKKIILVCLIISLLFTIPFLIVGNLGVAMVFFVLAIFEGILFLILKRYEILIEDNMIKITPPIGRRKVVPVSKVEKIIMTKQGHLRIIVNGKKVGTVDGMACGYGEFILFAKEICGIELRK